MSNVDQVLLANHETLFTARANFYDTLHV